MSTQGISSLLFRLDCVQKLQARQKTRHWRLRLNLSRLNLITPMNLISIIDRVKGEKNLARFSEPLSKLKPVSLELADYFYGMLIGSIADIIGMLIGIIVDIIGMLIGSIDNIIGMLLGIIADYSSHADWQYC